jgi:hypothetical protein
MMKHTHRICCAISSVLMLVGAGCYSDRQLFKADEPSAESPSAVLPATTPANTVAPQSVLPVLKVDPASEEAPPILSATHVAHDAGTRDGGAADSGARDSGASDSGGHIPDAGSRDTGPHDSGVVADSGVPVDAGTHNDGGPGPLNLVQDSNHGLPGCYRCAVAIADFDGDGKIDVVMAGAFDSAYTPDMSNYTFANAVRVYRNVSTPGGAIRFMLQEEMPNTTGGGGALVRIGDFNGDGLKDFAVQFRAGDTGVADTSAFLNHGGFTFTRSILVPGFNTQATSMGMAAADIDQDGLDDLIFDSDGYGAGPGLWYKYNPSAGTWSAQQTDYPHQITYGGSVSAADLDGDHFPDLVVGGNSSIPFGTHDCSSTLMYGEIHLNKGASASPRGIRQDALTELGRFALKQDRNNPTPCTGMDNASTLIADVDNDGHNDIIIAGSADAFNGPVGMDGSQYDFVVLRNVDGTGNNFVTFENAGVQYPGGTTNGGAGNVDLPNIAVGDLTGDGFPEIFIQGHHRDYAGDWRMYVFQTRLFVNDGGMWFTEVDIGLPTVGEGGQAMADFNNDGKIDLLFTGATMPWHSNGANNVDQNSASTLFTYVYRNVRP